LLLSNHPGKVWQYQNQIGGVIVDEITNFKTTDFYKKKIEMAEPTCVVIKQLKDKGHKIIFYK
jgi:hypothetical protein